MNLATKKIHVCRNVIFHEHVFPFTLSAESSSFPSVLRSIPSTDYTELASCDNCVSDYNNVTDTIPNYPPDHTIEDPIAQPPPVLTITSPTPPPHVPSTVVQRKSHRVNKIPQHLKDYIVNIPSLKPVDINTQNTQNHPTSLTALFTKHHHVSPDVIASNSQALVENVCHDSEPSSYEEASLSPV